jgi:hypothetical protein
LEEKNPSTRKHKTLHKTYFDLGKHYKTLGQQGMDRADCKVMNNMQET